jgi:gas vesicle protein
MSVTQYCEAEGNCAATATSRDYWIAGLALASGAALGALTMYLCDPHRGKTRRARLQEKAASQARRLADDLTARAEDALNRAKGAVAKLGAAVACHESDDDSVIAARVRSRLGRITRHAHAIKSQVISGVAILQGTLPEEEHDRVIAEIREVAGVKGVDDRIACAFPREPRTGADGPGRQRDMAHRL